MVDFADLVDLLVFESGAVGFGSGSESELDGDGEDESESESDETGFVVSFSAFCRFGPALASFGREGYLPYALCVFLSASSFRVFLAVAF